MSSQHDWELSKENAAPLECGRSTKSLSKRAFGTSSAEMIAIEEKTKKYEKLVRRSEKAVEWLQKQVKEITSASDDDPNRELTKDEADHLRERMTNELGFDPSTPDRDHLDYDPMRYWVLYIKHVRESYPSDSQRQFLIMERCARTFMYRPFLNPAYQNDIRFIRTCILYADKTSNPSEVFKLMSKIKVGTLTALFWVAWAWVAEKAEDFQFTEKIFQKALSVGAEPKKFLEERQKQFLRRMSRHWLNASQANEDNLEGGEEDEDGRGALNSISSAGLAANNRGSGFNRNSNRDRHHQTQRSHQLSRINENSSAGFSIFQDNDENAEDVLNDDDDDGMQRGRQLTKESERVKENRMRPESWNERGYGLKNPALAAETPMDSDSIVGTARDSAGYGGRQTSSSSFAAASFEVFVDDDCRDDDNGEDNDLSSKKVVNRSLRQRLDGGTAERLARDPLRYMKNPSKMESDHRKYEPKSDDRDIIERGETENVNNKRSEKQMTKTTKSGGVGGGYDKDLLKADGSGHECCFEEIRFERRYYNLISSEENFNFLKQETGNDENDTSQMDVETSIEDEDMEECTAEFDEHVAQLIEKPKSGMLKSSLRSGMKARTLEPPSNGSTRKVLFGANTNVEYKNNNESLNTTSGSSQLNGSFIRAEETINTKLANAEISMMFCSPNANVSRVESPGKPLFSSSRNNFNDEMNDTSNVASFAIHDDNAQENVAGGFSIVQDDADNESKGLTHDAEDTASHSLLGDVLTGLDTSPADSKPAAPSRKMVPSMRRPSFPSKSRSIAGSQPTETRRDSGEDTASLSVIGGVLGGIDSCNVGESPKKTSVAGFSIFSDENTSPKDSKPKSTDGGLSFAIYSDEIGESAAKKPKIWDDSENVCPEPSFGDISRIDDALDNERTRTNNLQLSDEYSKLKSKGSLLSAIEYTMEHRKSTETALRSCMKAAKKSNSGFSIFDHRGKPLPKALLRKSFPSGTNVDFLGGESATIMNELGRGVYGVVLLVDVSSEESNCSQRRALKVQAPIGSLAHEYSLLLEVEERVQPDPSGFYPFPRSEALYAFSQGGLFMMTAGSESGMNLIDVANTYKKIMGNVPELIAIYYTSRMLRHLESLHNEGKVLHCDVKPDNWVLTSSTARDAVRGCDLMLVDFGRAIDLEKVTRQGEHPLHTLFKGSIAAEDMECGNMREGLPWGVDLDYFGLCASAFILLFGSHMEVVRDKSTGTWRLNKVLRRYWQKDLWQSLFHSLLNFDLGSERKCLRDLRVAFDEYIDEERSREIATHLNQLFTHLPKKR